MIHGAHFRARRRRHAGVPAEENLNLRYSIERHFIQFTVFSRKLTVGKNLKAVMDECPHTFGHIVYKHSFQQTSDCHKAMTLET